MAREVVEEVGADRVRVIDVGAPGVWGLDAAKVRTALRNVVRNALQADPGPAPIDLSVTVEGAELVIRVHDHGPGLPPGEEARIFAPFYTARLHGTGLGLAVVRRVAELHGGEVVAHNHPDGGAEITLRLRGA